MPWMLPAAMIGSSLIGAGASMYGSSQQGEGGGYGVMTMPQYSFTEPRLNLTSDYLTSGLQNLMEGRYPAYYQNAMPQLQAGLQRELRKTYFGREGERSGLVQNAAELGAMTGIGPKATNAQVSKQMKDYADKESQINEYLTGLGVDIMRGSEQSYLNASIGMPQGPNSQMYGIPAQQGYQSPWGSAAATMAQNFPWESMFGGGGGGIQQGYAPPVAANTGQYAPYGYGTVQPPPLSSNMYAPPTAYQNPAYQPINLGQYNYR